MADELWFQSIAELSRQMAARTLSSVELTRAYLDRIDRLDQPPFALPAGPQDAPGDRLAAVTTVVREQQMTAGSWIYIGSQGIVQGTYETFVEAGKQHYAADLSGRWILTAGLGGMGGAQPLAAVFAGASCLVIECQQSRIDFRLRSRYLDEQPADLDDALARIARYTAEGKAVSIGLLGNAAEVMPELVRRAQAGAIRPDLVTDQTSAHYLVNGYLPAGWTVEQWRAAQADGAQHARRAMPRQRVAPST